MASTMKPIPEGYHSVTPYMICKGAAEAIEFYKKAFGAVEVMRMAGPNGQIGYAEIKIGDSHIMLSDEHPEMGIYYRQHYGGSPISVLLYVENADATVNAELRCCVGAAETEQDQQSEGVWRREARSKKYTPDAYRSPTPAKV